MFTYSGLKFQQEVGDFINMKDRNRYMQELLLYIFFNLEITGPYKFLLKII